MEDLKLLYAESLADSDTIISNCKKEGTLGQEEKILNRINSNIAALFLKEGINSYIENDILKIPSGKKSFTAELKSVSSALGKNWKTYINDSKDDNIIENFPRRMMWSIVANKNTKAAVQETDKDNKNTVSISSEVSAQNSQKPSDPNTNIKEEPDIFRKLSKNDSNNSEEPHTTQTHTEPVSMQDILRKTDSLNKETSPAVQPRLNVPNNKTDAALGPVQSILRKNVDSNKKDNAPGNQKPDTSILKKPVTSKGAPDLSANNKNDNAAKIHDTDSSATTSILKQDRQKKTANTGRTDNNTLTNVKIPMASSASDLSPMHAYISPFARKNKELDALRKERHEKGLSGMLGTVQNKEISKISTDRHQSVKPNTVIPEVVDNKENIELKLGQILMDVYKVSFNNEEEVTIIVAPLTFQENKKSAPIFTFASLKGKQISCDASNPEDEPAVIVSVGERRFVIKGIWRNHQFLSIVYPQDIANQSVFMKKQEFRTKDNPTIGHYLKKLDTGEELHILPLASSNTDENTVQFLSCLRSPKSFGALNTASFSPGKDFILSNGETSITLNSRWNDQKFECEYSNSCS